MYGPGLEDVSGRQHIFLIIKILDHCLIEF